VGQFTLYGWKADGMSLLQSHNMRWFCGGYSHIYVRCSCGSTWIYFITVINKCSNVGCPSFLSRCIFENAENTR